MSFLNLMRNRLRPKEVNEALTEVEGRVLPVTSTATTGQILKLTGENKTPAWADEYSYTPPAYSTTETDTGQKWIDGKDIYCLAFSGTTSETTGNEVIKTIEAGLNMLDMQFIYNDAGYTTPVQRIGSNIYYQSLSGGLVYGKGSTTGLLKANYTCIVYYTKPDPTPGRAPEDPEPEVETKKTTRKKKETNN